MLNNTKKVVAIKRLKYLENIKYENSTNKEVQDMITNEIDILKSIHENDNVNNSKYVINLYNYGKGFIDAMRNNHQIVFNAVGKTLTNCLTTQKGACRKYFAKLVADQIKIALDYLHINGICHTDLRPQNFVWYGPMPVYNKLASKRKNNNKISEGHLILIDLGLACEENEFMKYERSKYALCYYSKSVVDHIKSRKSYSSLRYKSVYDNDCIPYIQYVLSHSTGASIDIPWLNDFNKNEYEKREKLIASFKQHEVDAIVSLSPRKKKIIKMKFNL